MVWSGIKGGEAMITGMKTAEWLRRLVQIPSVTTAQGGPRAGIANELRIAQAVAGWFREFGGEVQQEEVFPNRPNVYGIWHGRTNRWAALDVHVDTAGVEQMTDDPFSGRIADGRVYGRGAVDTKASLAVALALLEYMHRHNRRPELNLLIAATVDEEGTACGAPVFAEWVRKQGLTLDQLAVAEPTRCAPVFSHRGILRMEFQVEGVSTHSSQPHLGKNAITAAAHLVLALEEEHRRLQTLSYPEGFGPPVLTVTLINGGRGISVVPDYCSVSIDRRVVVGEKATEVRDELLQTLPNRCPLPFTAKTLSAKDAFHQSPDSPWVRQLAEWSGMKPQVVPYCTNALSYGGLARECVVIGPGSIDQAHGAQEWVEVSELEKLTDIYCRWWGLRT